MRRFKTKISFAMALMLGIMSFDMSRLSNNNTSIVYANEMKETEDVATPGDYVENDTNVSTEETEDMVEEDSTDVNEKVYQGNGYDVVFTVDSKWQGGYNATITIKNTTDTVIENWHLMFDYEDTITNIWNATIESYEEGKYLIKNYNWNQDILANGSVSFGISSDKSFVDFPNEYSLLSNKNKTNMEDVSVEYIVDNEYQTGFNGSIIIYNNSDKILEDWVLEFDYDRNITSIWNAAIVSKEDNHYIIKNSDYNSNINPGENVTVGFLGEGGSNENEPYNYELSTYGAFNEGVNVNKSKVELVGSQIEIGYQDMDSKESVTKDIYLPTNIDDVIIEWSSSNESIITNAGVVYRPEEESCDVELKATITCGDYSEEKIFTVKVIKSLYVDYDTAFIEDFDDYEYLAMFNDDLESLEIYENEEGYLNYVIGSFSDIVVESPEEALLSLYNIKTLMGCEDPKTELEWSHTSSTRYGKSFAFYQVKDGIPVYGSSIVVSADNDGKTVSFNSSFIGEINAVTTYTISDADAENILINSGYTNTLVDKLYLYQKDDYTVVSAWNVLGLKDGNSYNVLVDANTGDVLLKNAGSSGDNDLYEGGETKTATETADNGLKHTVNVWYMKDNAYEDENGPFYYMIDRERNIYVYKYDNSGVYDELNNIIKTINNKWNQGQLNRAFEAMYNTEKSYDYYTNMFGVYGMNGQKISVQIDWDNDNAVYEYDTNTIRLGTNNAYLLDIVAHEYTHGIVAVKTDLEKYYFKEPGAINEAYADIFGNFVEGRLDWTNNIRNIKNPKLTKNPIAIGGEYYINYNGYDDSVLEADTSYDRGGVHLNSTIISHTCYYMYSNGINDADRLAELWYGSLIKGYSKSSTFKTVRQNVLATANEMRMSSNEIKIIKAAFDAAGIADENKITIKGTNIITGKVVEVDFDGINGNNNVIKNADVTLTRRNSTSALHTVTQQDGCFQFNDITPGYYNLEISKPGYIPVTQEITVKSVDYNNYLNTIQMIPNEYSGLGTAKGKLKDALTGDGVEGLTLSIRKGNNSTTGKVLATLTSDKDGCYSISTLATGYYCVTVTDKREDIDNEQKYCSTYFNIIVVGGKIIPDQNAVVTKELDKSELRIVLEWGSYPRDLDSHLKGPKKNGGSFHVYYSSKKYKENDEVIAMLDLDDTSSYGPETTTLYKTNGGMYTFYVYNYSSGTDMSASEAVVKVYLSTKNEPAYVFNIPTDQKGRYWTVFKYDSEKKKIIPINATGTQVQY